ncbi:sulfotransferase family protein [Isoptericola sp. CG 20/1183]|uniref:Sulfotransferase family protein n=1 Tax=Isoptericola halotolerans TaxID=300560 RepID=A0ABX5EFU0_9MICO|nr:MULTISPECIES: sulfotransferase family 2 domain-containing protein [Isoptericola]PRZ04940.1 sulfotransferase family protein [Isoptericola halotolerans]PRZ05431.1 sulfotransferase family protein [Isoptericola sp. CG 20/1183]
MSVRSAQVRGRVELSGARPQDATDAGSVWNSMVVPRCKVVFVNVSKNASTSLKWLTAELSGQDPAVFHSVMGLAPTRQQTIHRRASWVGVPKLTELDADARAEISPDNGWFVFGVIRDPRLRAWSAWQSKFLVGNPRHAWHKFRDAPWMPRVPRDDDDVVADFARFVEALGGPGGQALLGDSHFKPQTDLLNEDVVPYSHLYEVSELPLLLADLRTHLEAQGLPGTYALTRENETPLSVAGRVFGADVLEALNGVYARDIERFGHLWDFDKVLAKDPAWSPEAFRDIAGRVATGQRIADLALGADHLRAEVRELEAGRRADARQVARLEARVADLEAALQRRTLRGLPGAVAGRVRKTFSGT